MKRIVLAAIAAPLALAACGGAANDITTTNTDQVVLNDAQANYVFRNDDEQPSNAEDAANAGMLNGAEAMDAGMMNDTASNAM
jgi:hypothetical protein